MTAVESLLNAQGESLAGIVATAYYPSVAIATYLSDEKYSHIKAVAIDTDEKVLQAVRDNVLIGTMSQNPYGQAYVATLTAKMLIDGWTYKEGEDFLIDSGSFLVTAENIDRYDEMKIETTNEILKTWIAKFNPPQ
jgi:ribose transport system substrate-binding protein